MVGDTPEVIVFVIVSKKVQSVKQGVSVMKEKKAEREYAHVLNDMIKDLDGFKINPFDNYKNNYQRRLGIWKVT